MSNHSYQVKDVARIAGVSVRTLHHYHDIGLLVPSGRTGAGYRLYDEDDLLRLQQILLHRELGFSLERIRRMLDHPGYDRVAALREQRRLLVEQSGRTARMIGAVDAALETLTGERAMDPNGLFDGFDPRTYEEEVRERWGETEAYRESSRRTRAYTKEEWAKINGELDSLLEEAAGRFRAGARPGDPDVIELAERHRLHIDRWYYPCSRFRHAGLAEMYVTDERFAGFFERYGEGMAEFFADAIRANSAIEEKDRR